MMNQQALQRRMRCGSRHPQQHVGELLFDTNQLLQFRNVHVLEMADFHGGSPFVDPSRIRKFKMEPEERSRPLFRSFLNMIRGLSVPSHFLVSLLPAQKIAQSVVCRSWKNS